MGVCDYEDAGGRGGGLLGRHGGDGYWGVCLLEVARLMDENSLFSLAMRELVQRKLCNGSLGLCDGSEETQCVFRKERRDVYTRDAVPRCQGEVELGFTGRPERARGTGCRPRKRSNTNASLTRTTGSVRQQI